MSIKYDLLEWVDQVIDHLNSAQYKKFIDLISEIEDEKIKCINCSRKGEMDDFPYSPKLKRHINICINCCNLCYKCTEYFLKTDWSLQDIKMYNFINNFRFLECDNGINYCKDCLGEVTIRNKYFTTIEDMANIYNQQKNYI